MLRPPRAKETPIERIYREVNGDKMPSAVKRILLRPHKAKAQTQKRLESNRQQTSLTVESRHLAKGDVALDKSKGTGEGRPFGQTL